MMNIKLPYIVPNSLKKNLIDFAINHDNMFIDHGNKYYGQVVNSIFNFDSIHTDLASKVKKFSNSLFDEMKMFNRILETYLGSSIIIVKQNGYVQQHVDNVPREISKNYWHFRVNFLLLAAEIGGDPIIENKLYKIKENESWFNLANLWQHGCTMVEGNKPRIILSCGSFVHKSEIKAFLMQHFKKPNLDNIYG